MDEIFGFSEFVKWLFCKYYFSKLYVERVSNNVLVYIEQLVIIYIFFQFKSWSL